MTGDGMNNVELVKFLEIRLHWDDVIIWLGDRDSTQMWADCERPDVLLMYAAAHVSTQELVSAACDCAETALRYVPQGEDRPRVAIEAARRWTRGEANMESVCAAANASEDVAGDAASAATHAAACAGSTYNWGHACAAARAACSAVARYSANADLCSLIRQRWPVCPEPSPSILRRPRAAGGAV